MSERWRLTWGMRRLGETFELPAGAQVIGYTPGEGRNSFGLLILVPEDASGNDGSLATEAALAELEEDSDDDLWVPRNKGIAK